MLVGTSIVMAWQSKGRWHVAWQFAALGCGLLFTTSIGLVRVDSAVDAPWLARAVKLLISTGMMTLMTWVGLPRVLPKGSDWIVRGRQAFPVFASTSLSLLTVVVISNVLHAS